ncbi:MAG: hypothetical protein VYA17_04670 [Pseudomonadota bacterium]|nr:hypothetical protein [Pseudomonadota bacterium]
MARTEARRKTAKTCLVLLTAGAMVSGCSFASDVMWPSLTGENPASKSGEKTQVPISRAEANSQPTLSPPPPPALGRTNFVPPRVTAGSATGTDVGRRVVELRRELKRLQSQIGQQNVQLQEIRRLTVQHSRTYHTTVGAMNARLQVGTTPGNPALVTQWNVAQANLAQVEKDIAQMNKLANGVASTSTLSAFLLETTRAAYGLSGAVDEDHRQLSILEDEVNRTVVLIDRLLNELSEDISRQSNYLSTERTNLNTLALAVKNGEILGASLVNRAFASSTPLASNSPTAAPRMSSDSLRRPLVVIRFDRANVQYEQPLYNAISRALQRRPNAMFDLVAVAPGGGNAARVALASSSSKKNAETVLRSLSDMGLPLERVRLSALTSHSAQTGEVHLYVR